MTPSIAHRQKIERTIVELIVREAISKGYSISGFDGEDDIFQRLTDPDEIMKNVMHVDEETLNFHRPNGTYAGFVFLVYGNDGYDAINDHTATDEMADILHRAVVYANTAEDQAFDERIAKREAEAKPSDDPMDDFNYVGSRHHY